MGLWEPQGGVWLSFREQAVQLDHLPAVLCCTNSLIMLGLSFLICQMDVIVACMSHHCQEEDNSSQVFFPIH